MLVEAMPEPERNLYESFEALTLEAAFPGRRMVVYTLRNGVPKDIEMLFLGDFKAGLEVPLGLTIEITDSMGSLEVGPVPTRYRGRDLFLQVPQNFTLKWKGKQNSAGPVEFVPHYAILMKMRSKREGVEGNTYCLTMNRFNERFPGLNIRY